MILSPRWAYRVRQFNKIWEGGLSAAERVEVRQVLGPELHQLFRQMAVVAQRHAYDVYATLRQQGWADNDLLAAALLHDVGKGRLNVVQRSMWVLLGALSLGLRERLAQARPWGGWLGLQANLQHAAAGADLVAAHGGSPDAVRLIREHYRHAPEDSRLVALQQADDDN